PEPLEPRADTEVLVDLALKESPPQRVLDLGTGTGCILLAILKHCPAASGIGIDQSQGALDMAQINAADHGLETRVRFLRGDWASGVSETFDLVVSNPPYIESGVIPGLQNEVKNYDPILALDGGADGMEAYKIIFSQLRAILKPGGTALFEIGYDQSRKIERLAGEHGFNAISIHSDYAGNPRVAKISA
ncbi:MAG TPA: peptide chain release factor N(5)-glutamine methyltransferase, partial [Alphaproteobacteria bacterium]|nr:peptide chain release factor N(5)-glutamine methyltransferase [Alphaproteobacteria bacterium]